MSEEILWAWAAGLFEGEGMIVHYRTTRGDMFRQLALGSTDRDIVYKFYSIVGVGKIVQEFPKGNRKVLYRWRVNGRDNLELVLTRFLPYLGMRRRAKAEKLLADLPTLLGLWKRPDVCKRAGHPLDGVMSNGKRFCKTCKIELQRERRKR